MRNGLFIILFAPFLASAQVPSVTGNTSVAVREGDNAWRASLNTIFGAIDVDLTGGVTGILPVANGGTGATSHTAGQLLYGNGTSAVASSAALSFSSSILRIQNTSALTGFLNAAAQENIRIQNTDATNNNWSSITNYGSAGDVNAAIGFQNIDQSTREAAVSVYTYGSLAFHRVARFHHAGITLDKAVTASSTLAVTGASTFTGSTTHNGGLIVNTVAPIINTQLTLGTSSTGSKLNVWNNYSSTSAASNSNYAAILMRNVNQTANNWTAIQWTAGNPATGGSIAAAIGCQVTDHTNGYANIGFQVRGATGGFGQVMLITANKSVVIGNTTASARLHVTGSGATSSTDALLVENSSGTDMLRVQDNGTVAIKTAPVATQTLTVRGATSDATEKVFVAERASGTDVLGVQNDGKVSINNAAYTEAVTVNGKVQADQVVLNTSTASNVLTGNIIYTDDATHGGYLTLGDGDRQLAIMPTTVERHVLDWAVDWTIGRKGAFFTVPARFNGWKISKAYISVTNVGGGSDNNELTIELGGVSIGTQIVTAGTHTLVLDEVVATSDIITFNITEVRSTPAEGLHVALELSKN